jgi:hypothetical protein
MASDEEHANEHTHLLPHKRLGSLSVRHGSDAGSIISSHLSKDELALGNTAVGERLAYNDYTTIDWLHDLVRSNPPDFTPTATDSLIRSKTPSEVDRSIAGKVFATISCPRGIPVKDG